MIKATKRISFWHPTKRSLSAVAIQALHTFAKLDSLWYDEFYKQYRLKSSVSMTVAFYIRTVDSPCPESQLYSLKL